MIASYFLRNFWFSVIIKLLLFQFGLRKKEKQKVSSGLFLCLFWSRIKYLYSCWAEIDWFVLLKGRVADWTKLDRWFSMKFRNQPKLVSCENGNFNNSLDYYLSSKCQYCTTEQLFLEIFNNKSTSTFINMKVFESCFLTFTFWEGGSLALKVVLHIVSVIDLCWCSSRQALQTLLVMTIWWHVLVDIKWSQYLRFNFIHDYLWLPLLSTQNCSGKGARCYNGIC